MSDFIPVTHIAMKTKGIILAAVIAALFVGGCSGSLSERRKIDYKSADRLPPLEVPPDLVTPRNSDRYAVPEAGGATFSEYTRERNASQGQTGEAVVPVQDGMYVARSGTYRWLVVNTEPETVWPQLREFWQETGFLIARESPETGIMETDWAENRAKVNLGPVRKFIKGIFDSAYSYPERDKFRVRIERGETEGTSEIYISHQGMAEVLTREGRSQESTMWQVRPRDPELEAEMLYRLMARLGGSQAQIEQARATPPPPPRAELASDASDLEYLTLRDPFDRAWRRVGLALDYIGFTVEDRDRSQGVYFVRYNDPDVDGERKGLAKLAFWRDDKPVDRNFRIRVRGEDGSDSEVHVLDAEGKELSSPTAKRILALLRDELK